MALRTKIKYNCDMKIAPFVSIVCFLTVAACAPQPQRPSVPLSPMDTATLVSATFTAAPSPTFTVTPLPTRAFTPTATDTPTPTAIPTVESLSATVNADKLSCRYGPGAEYLYLVAFNRTAKLKLIGRADANNWVLVSNTDGQNRSANCWVNKKFLDVQGDMLALSVVYPGLTLPVSPYYPGPKWVSAKRDENGKVVISWEPVPISPGKYEDENMHQYIVEVWRCEAGRTIFETLGSNEPFITIGVDEAGCVAPSWGRVFVQEKHGYGGPVEIPWPQP
ncbi:MAG: hypothetical protein B6D38_02710 [Anaerolineae bacterium UTCFX1]|nr:MAG: hypothetical protein B6D38_02710 [Anaerolineae bacterium UTCFX1]